MLNRRSFLRNVPAAGVALTVPAVALAEAKPPLTGRERLDAAIAELQAALRELYPDWKIQTRNDAMRNQIWVPNAPFKEGDVYRHGVVVMASSEKSGPEKLYWGVSDGPLLAEDAGCHKVLADLERRMPA